MPNRYYKKTIVNIPKYIKKIDIDTVDFIGKMTEKLITMIHVIDKRIEDARQENTAPTQVSGFGYAEIPQIKVQIKQEYIVYICKYGPPTDGIFNMTLLNDIREKLGITE